MLLTTENTSIPDVELSDIPNVELSDVFYNGKISSDIWSIKQIDEIINIFLITATEALKILTRNKVQDIDINGLNIIKNEMYFSIHEFANISRFYTETFPDNAIISENIYALHFHYLQKIIPKVLSYESLNKNNLTDIMGAMSEII